MTPSRTLRLLVTWRNPATSGYEAIGELVHHGGRYTFTYRDDASLLLPGMTETDRPYVSDELFPLFEHRVISPRRKDHDEYLADLGLPPDATPFEVLTRSGGRSAVDTLELTPMPEAGPVDMRFLVHGIRHLTQDERERIGALQPGQNLTLAPEPRNPVDPSATLVTDEGHRLGWVPRPLVEQIAPMLGRGYSLTVDRVNPTSAGFHMRLLVRLVGDLPV